MTRLRLCWYSLMPLWLLMVLGVILNHYWPPYWIILTIIAGFAYVVGTVIEQVQDYQKYAKHLDNTTKRAWYALGNTLMCLANSLVPILLLVPNRIAFKLFIVGCVIMMGAVMVCIKAER